MPTTMIMREMEEPRPTFVLRRGEYNQQTDEVSPAVPSFLPPIPEELPKNRLGLARWLVSEEHPLTTRVTANRMWQRFFGRGLVGTSGDFGSQGEWPSRFRLDAEVIRDGALAAAGLLVEKLGGPSVKPYQPPGLWREIGYESRGRFTAGIFKQDEGDALYRRSLYTFWKRTVPPPLCSGWVSNRWTRAFRTRNSRPGAWRRAPY